MPRRNRRRSPSSSSDNEEPDSFTTQTNTSAIVVSTSAFQASTSACQAPTPRMYPRQLDSALEALADRVGELSDDEDPALEVVEAYASHAESEVVQASALNAESEVVQASASNAELLAPAKDLLLQDDCVITGVSRAESARTIDNKLSIELTPSSRDLHLIIHQGQEEREREQRKVVERYKALQLTIDSDIREMMRDPEVSKLPDVSQVLEGILSSLTRELPGFTARTDAGFSPSVQAKNPGASGASAEQNRNSVLPSQGAQEFTQVATSQGGESASGAKQSNAPAPLNRIVLAEAAATVLLHRAYIYSTENLNFCVERGVSTPFQWVCQ